MLFVRERPDLAARERAMVLALAGTGAYGIVLFYYFVDRSAVHVLVYVCLPLLLSWTIWLAFILRTRDTRPRAVAIASSLALAVLLVAVAWSSIGPRFERSALAHMPPGGPGLRDALDRLTDFPPVNLNSPKAERMLARHLPGERRSLVLIRPDIITEVLMRSERSNRLPLADPIEDGFTLEERQPGLRAAAAELEEGDRMLLDDAALLGLAAVKANPGSDLLEQPVPGAATAPLELYALREIDRRFVMRPVARADGYVVVELEAR